MGYDEVLDATGQVLFRGPRGDTITYLQSWEDPYSLFVRMPESTDLMTVRSFLSIYV